METSPYYDFRDVLLAPAKALTAKKIFVMTLFLCAGLVVYDFFTYFAVAVNDERLSSYYHVYGLTPLVYLRFSNWLAQILYWIGIVAGLLVLMLGFFAVSAINIEETRGNRFFTVRGAVKFSLRRFTQLFLSELAIALFVGFMVLLAFLLGLLTRIPYLGEWIYALFFAIPNFIIFLFVVFIVFVMVVSIVLLPAVAAAERHGETFSAILETFSTIIRQPVRWLLYTSYSLVAAKVAGFVYAYFCYRAVQFLTYSASLGAGDKVWRLLKSGLSHLPVNSNLVRETCNVFPGIDWSFSFPAWARGGGNEAAGHVMAFMLFLIFASVIGYMLAIIATAQARGYVAVRYIKDNYKIPDEKPLFFEEEHVNPPMDEGKTQGA
ncbi:MAG: hypothetical protein ACE5K8_03180 [Candidatus Zixiibacteriota bacterium]